MSGRRLLVMTACLVLAQFALSVTRPMTSYRLLELGYSGSTVGWVSVLFAITPLLLFLPASGWVAGRGIVPVGVLSSVLASVGCAGLAFGTDLVTLAVANIVLGAGSSGQMLTYQSVIARESGDGYYDRDYGWMAVGVSLGQLIGPIAGTFALQQFGGGLRGTSASMSLAVGAAVLGVVVTMLLLRDPRVAAGASERPPARLWQRMNSTLSRPGAKAAVYVSLIVTSVVDLWTVYLPVLGQERGWTPTLVGALLAIRAATSLLARLALTAALGHLSRRRILIATVTLAAATVGLVPFLDSAVTVIAAVCLLGLGLGIGQPLTLAWSVAVVPAEEQSTSIALRLMGNRVGQVTLPVLAALVVVVGGGASVVFVFLGSLLLSSTAAVIRSKNI